MVGFRGDVVVLDLNEGIRGVRAGSRVCAGSRGCTGSRVCRQSGATMVLPGNPATDLDVAVVVRLYDDVVLVEAWELAVELVALLVLFEIEARDEVMPYVIGGVAAPSGA